MNSTSSHQKEAIRQGSLLGKYYSLCNPTNSGNTSHGQYRGKQAGQSLDYRDFRDYQPGDDLRCIDWSAYARSDRLAIKVFYEELSPHLDLIIDTSASMSITEEKNLLSYAVTAFLTTIAEQAKFSFTIWTCSEQGIKKMEGSIKDPTTWQELQFSEPYSLAEAFHLNAPCFKPRGIRLIVSDFLFPGDPQNLLLHLLNNMGSAAMIQILSPQDLNPFPLSFAQIEDAETGEKQDVFFDTTAQQRYQENLQHHLKLWYENSRHYGIPLVSINKMEDMKQHLCNELMQYGFLTQ